MRLIVNGETYETMKADTIQGLLDELGISSIKVAVEVNLNIIKKADYSNYNLKEGDRIEIVNFVGGG